MCFARATVILWSKPSRAASVTPSASIRSRTRGSDRQEIQFTAEAPRLELSGGRGSPGQAPDGRLDVVPLFIRLGLFFMLATSPLFTIPRSMRQLHCGRVSTPLYEVTTVEIRRYVGQARGGRRNRCVNLPHSRYPRGTIT